MSAHRPVRYTLHPSRRRRASDAAASAQIQAQADAAPRYASVQEFYAGADTAPDSVTIQIGDISGVPLYDGDLEAADGLAGAAGHDLLTALGNPVGSCRVPGGLFLGFHGVRRGVHRHLCGRPVLAQILKGPNLTGGRPRARTPPSVPPAARPAGLVKSLAGLAIAPPARTA